MNTSMIAILLRGAGFWGIAAGLPLGTATAVALLARFRALVARSMRDTARKAPLQLSTNDSAEISAPALPAEVQTKRELVIRSTLPEEVLSNVTAKRHAWRVALVYAAAVTVLALIMLNILRVISPFDPSECNLLAHLLLFAEFFCVFATPAALAATYVIRKQVRYLALAVLGLLSMVALWDIFLLHGALFNLWLWVGAAPTAVALLLATRPLRAVGPVVIVGTVVWTVTSVVLIGATSGYALDVLGFRFVRPDLQELSLAAAIEKFLPELLHGSPDEMLNQVEEVFRSGEGRIFTLQHPDRENTALWLWTFAGFVVAIIVGAVAAWGSISWLASRYRRRKTSDQMLAIDVMVLTFVLYIILFIGIFFDFEESAIIILLSIISLIAYRFIVVAAFSYLTKARPPEPSRTLLMLRVFGFARRSQRLLDDLGQHWRYLGPINLIAGTDLAFSIIEPHEFYEFLRGHLSRAFVKDQEDLESRLRESTPVADPDGLFRIQDFYCHDDTWGMTVARLAAGADAVFMDLRGFTASNYGCLHEIKVLVHVVPMDRVVLLVDKTTDLPLLEHTLAEAWRRLPVGSPNAPLAQPVVRVLRVSKNYWLTLNALMSMLCAPFDRPGDRRLRPSL